MASSLSDALQIVVRTDPGVVRTHNEDAVFANVDLGLVILADGMGGYKAGEVASAMAIASLSAALDADFSRCAPQEIDADSGERVVKRCLLQQIQAANSAIYHAAKDHAQWAGMGTTLLAAVFYDNQVAVAHLGDSRLYRLRGTVLSAVTRDHSLIQSQIESGLLSPTAARCSVQRHLLTRALGIEPAVSPEIHEYPVMPGDVYLLCSDGLNDMVEDEVIGRVLNAQADDLALAANQLVETANNNGGLDNVSVVLVKVLRGFPASHSGGRDVVRGGK